MAATSHSSRELYEEPSAPVCTVTFVPPKALPDKFLLAPPSRSKDSGAGHRAGGLRLCKLWEAGLAWKSWVLTAGSWPQGIAMVGFQPGLSWWPQEQRELVGGFLRGTSLFWDTYPPPAPSSIPRSASCVPAKPKLIPFFFPRIPCPQEPLFLSCFLLLPPDTLALALGVRAGLSPWKVPACSGHLAPMRPHVPSL